YFNYYFSSFLFLLPNKKNAPNAASKDPNNVVFTISDSPVLGKAFLFSFCLDFSSAFPLLSFFIISLLFVCFIADILDCFSGILDVISVVFLASFIGTSFILLVHSFSSDFSSDVVVFFLVLLLFCFFCLCFCFWLHCCFCCHRFFFYLDCLF